jgi:hypothetical protein
MQVDRHVLGEVLSHEDVVQQAPIARAVQDGVVADVRPLARVPLVPKYQTNRPIDQRDRFSRLSVQRLRCAAQEVAIGVPRIGVGDDDVGGISSPSVVRTPWRHRSA